MKFKIIVFLFIFLLLGILSFSVLKNRFYTSKLDSRIAQNHPNINFINKVEEKVIVVANPKMNFSYDVMTDGVIQHLDRYYTYDYIPDKLKNGILFQGIHRPEKGNYFEN